MADYSRHKEIFDPTTFDYPVHIIGCGATGSWVASMIGRLGVKNIHIHDFDIVEAHNLPNQAFDRSDLGKLKVRAVKDSLLMIDDEINQVTMHEEAVTKDTKLEGIVFLLTDTMSSRKDIFSGMMYNPSISAVIETRMGTDCGNITVFDPARKDHIKKFQESLFDDDEVGVETSACGVAQTLAPTAMWTASAAVWQFLNIAKMLNEDGFITWDRINNYQMFGMEHAQAFVKSWAE